MVTALYASARPDAMENVPPGQKKIFCLKSLRPLILSGFLYYPKAIVPAFLLYKLLYFIISFLTVPNNKASGVPKAFQELITKRLSFT